MSTCVEHGLLYTVFMIEKTKQSNKTSTTKHQDTSSTIKPPATNQSKLKDKLADKPLTRKQEAFVQELLTNPKQSATQAALKTYGKPDKELSYGTAQSIATENLSKPVIMSKLGLASDMVETALMQTVEDWKQEENSRKREIAMDTAKYIHDKVHGKATQRVEQQTTTVSVAIDLSGMATTEQG